jgi:Ca-activated chloride channel homolog
MPPIACAVALILLMDVSASVNADGYHLQQEGTAKAFLSSDVQAQVRGGAPVAVEVIQWDATQRIVLPWRILSDGKDVQAFSSDIARAERTYDGFGFTYLHSAITFGTKAMEDAPCATERHVIDISGDGKDNQPGGEENAMSIARTSATDHGVTINGLPIINNEPDVVAYYQDNVVTPDGFVVQANGFEDVERAMRRKLFAEIAGVRPSFSWAGR